MANMEQIAILINDCWHYFKMSNPPDLTVKSWAAELSDIDLYNAGAYITRKFKLLPDFPRNFPVAIKTIYREWRQNQPQQKEEAAGCPKCQNGLLHATREIGQYKYSFSFRCLHCRTSELLIYPEQTRDGLEMAGYTLDWTHDYTGPRNRDIERKIAINAQYEPRQRNYTEPEPIPF